MSGDTTLTKALSTHVFLTEVQLSERWQISVKKLQADRYSGRGCGFVRMGRSVRYQLTTVERYESLNTFHSGAPRSAPTK